MKNLPELTKQPILHLDATPDTNYPIRILEAYRQDCDSRWATGTDGSVDNLLLRLMNEHQEQRATILDKAIETLRREL